MAKEICEKSEVVAQKPIMNRRCCYANSIEEFLKESVENWLGNMKSAFSAEYMLALGESQIRAWKDCFAVLQEQLLAVHSNTPGFQIIFEYALPYESGRRPDVILVCEEYVMILEFKGKNEILESDVDQACGYERDIREYHFESREKKIQTFLVLTKGQGIRTGEYSNLIVCSKEKLGLELNDVVWGWDDTRTITVCDVQKWICPLLVGGVICFGVVMVGRNI